MIHGIANTVTIAKYFPNTISTSETGEVNNNRSVLFFRSSANDFIDKTGPQKYTMSIYPKLWNHPIKYTLDTRHNTVFTEVTEALYQHSIGRASSYEDGIEVLPEPEEVKCYEVRFKPVRDKKKNREYNVKYCQEHKEENARRQKEYRARQKIRKAKTQ